MIFNVVVNNVIASVSNLQVLTAGMVNGRAVQFNFSPDWENLNKTAVFTNGIDTKIVPEYKWENGVALIPPEVLSVPHQLVKCGVYGINENNEVVIPTLWVELGRVFPSASPGEYEESVPPTPNVWDDLQNQIGVLSKLNTEDKANLVNAVNECLAKGVKVGEIVDALQKTVDDSTKSLQNQIGVLKDLNTTYKENLIGAVNECLADTSLKRSVRGNIVFIDDSIKDRDIKVKTNCPYVTQMGKNLIDYTTFYPNATHTISGGEEIIHFDSVNEAKELVPIPDYLIGKTVTVSAWLKRSQPVYDRRIRINIYREGGSLKGTWAGEYVDFPDEVPAEYGQSYITFTVKEGDAIQIVSASPNATVWVKNMMISFSTNTEYEKYNPTVYSTGNSNIGIVKEVKGIKGSDNTIMLIGTGNGYVSAEYNRDINKAFDELKQAIIALGGTV